MLLIVDGIFLFIGLIFWVWFLIMISIVYFIMFYSLVFIFIVLGVWLVLS